MQIVQSWRRQTAPTVAVVEKIAEIRQFMDKVVCTPVGVQQQVLVVTVQKTAEVPHMQLIDEFVAVPVGNLLYGGYGGDEALLRVVPSGSACFGRQTPPVS